MRAPASAACCPGKARQNPSSRASKPKPSSPASPPDDPAQIEADALHLEDHRLYARMANLITIALILHLFFLAPFLAALAGADRGWRLLVHLLLSLPLYAAAWWVWRRRLLPWGSRIVLRGKAARQAAALAAALDLLWIGWRV